MGGRELNFVNKQRNVFAIQAAWCMYMCTCTHIQFACFILRAVLTRENAESPPPSEIFLLFGNSLQKGDLSLVHLIIIVVVCFVGSEGVFLYSIQRSCHVVLVLAVMLPCVAADI